MIKVNSVGALTGFIIFQILLGFSDYPDYFALGSGVFYNTYTKYRVIEIIYRYYR